MVKYELLMLRTSFELNVRKPSYVASHIALFLTCLIIGVSFALTPQYLFPDQNPLGSASSDVVARNVLSAFFALMLLYTVLRGVFSKGVRNYMTRADADFLAFTPVNPRSLVTAKCAKALVSRISMTFLAFFIMFPVSLTLGTPLLLFFVSLLSFTLYIEFLQAASIAIQSVSDVARLKLPFRIKFALKISVVAASAAVIILAILSPYFPIQQYTAVLGQAAENLWVNLPSSIAASSIVKPMFGNTETLAQDTLFLAAFIGVSLVATHFSLGPFHPEQLLPIPLPVGMQNPFGLRVEKLLEDRFSWQKPSQIVFLKDLKLTLRGALIDFSLLNFILMYGVSFAAWFLLESVLPIQAVPDFEELLGPLRIFVKEFVLILALMPFIPSLTSFSREMGKIWILKSFPFKSRSSAEGKFLFALTISAVSLAPMALVAGWVFRVSFSEWMLGVLLPFILLIANSFGVLIGAYMPPYDLSNQISLKSASAFFISLIILLSPFIFVVSVHSVLFQVVIIAAIAAYSLLATNLFLKAASRGFDKMELKRVLPRNPRLEQSTIENH